MRAVVDQDITPTERLTTQLPETWDVTVGLDGTTEAAIEGLHGAHVVFATSRIPLSRRVIEAAPDLKVIGKLGTGIDSIDVEAAGEHDVAVTHTPGYNALGVAEHTVGLLLATARNLTESRTIIESGNWRDEAPIGTQISGKTVGLVGFGNVGTRVGKLLSGFDVDLLIHDPYVPAIDAELVGGEMVSFDRLLGESDAVLLTAELTDETRGMIDAQALNRMNDSAILVNTARGALVDEEALVAALRNGAIGGAGLDVFATEPLGDDTELLELDNVVLTPHVGGSTTESRRATIDRLVENVVALVEGRPVPEQFIATPD